MNAKEAVVTGVMAVLLLCGSAGCSSTRPPQPIVHPWEELFLAAESGGASYDATTLAEKWRELDALSAEVGELGARMAALSRSFRFL